MIAKGNTAEVYEYGENRICKLFYPGYPREYIEHEFGNAKLTHSLGIRTPKAHEIIVKGDRAGIVYERIDGEELHYKVYEEAEGAFDTWLDKFVIFQKQLSAYEVADALNYKDYLRLFAAKEETFAKIDNLPEDDHFLHSDFHFKNVMVDACGDLVLIDMMNICKGPVLFDVARTYFLFGYDTNLQEEYLRRMGYTLESIMPYLDVIREIRENEMKV